MNTWWEVRLYLTSPRGVIAVAVLLAVAGAVAGLAVAAGTATHPVVGWAVVVLAIGAPAGWTGRKAVEEIVAQSRAERVARSNTENLPDDMRRDSSGETRGRTGVGRVVRPVEVDDGPPSRDWP